MMIKVYKLFGREVLRVEEHYEATVSDVVRSIMENRRAGDEVVYECECDEGQAERYAAMVSGGMIPCECCGEMFDPVEEAREERMRQCFNDIADRINLDEDDDGRC